MKKLFISADIEGTAGIAHWDEANRKTGDYAYFAMQMTREVNAACQGALDAGIRELLVKDGHGSGRNINPANLPREARVFRGWGRHPFMMMFGLDKSFHGVVFTGYHSAAQANTNPLSHTVSTQNNYVKINGELASELMINSLTAAYMGVPVFCVCGDKGLCEWIKTVNPNIATVAVLEGFGSGAFGMHPDLAVSSIRETVAEALKQPRESCMFPLPKHFEVEINYKEHFMASSNSFYPGASLKDTRTVLFRSDDYFDVLRFFHFAL